MIFREPKARPRSAGAELYDDAVAQSRAPALYSDLGAPDTIEGRFELLTLHVILLIERLRDDGAAAAQSSQALFDIYCSNLDGALREMGVGDLTVGKRMRALGEAFYGRARAYRMAFAALPDRGELAAVIGRTVMAGESGADPTALAAYVARSREALAAVAAASLLASPPPWPAS